MEKDLDVLLLPKTWLKGGRGEVSMTEMTAMGFSVSHRPLTTGRGGGLAIINFKEKALH